MNKVLTTKGRKEKEDNDENPVYITQDFNRF